MIIGDNAPAKIDKVLVKALARAHTWYEDLISGRVKSIAEIATRDNNRKTYVRNVMKLVFLAPDIIEAIIAGKQPVDLTADKLIKRNKLPLDWEKQRAEFRC